MDDQAIFQNFLQHRKDIDIMPIAENGEELCDMLERITADELLPDLVILDQNMPKCNGLQTLKMLKENTRFRDLTVFIYSTYADNKLIVEGMENGAAAIVTKPINRSGYEEMIDLFIKYIS